MNQLVALFCVSVLWAVAACAQPDTVTPNENLAADGVPPVPLSLVEGAQRYSNFRAAGFASWNPVQREMLIATRFADSYQVHQVKMPGGARTQLTFSSEPSLGAQFNPRDGKTFIFRKDVVGAGFCQTYGLDI